jgi:hypothetical protein
MGVPGFRLRIKYLKAIFTCTPMSVAVLEKMPPTLATARATTTAWMEFVTIAYELNGQGMSSEFQRT